MMKNNFLTGVLKSGGGGVTPPASFPELLPGNVQQFYDVYGFGDTHRIDIGANEAGGVNPADDSLQNSVGDTMKASNNFGTHEWAFRFNKDAVARKYRYILTVCAQDYNNIIFTFFSGGSYDNYCGSWGNVRAGEYFNEGQAGAMIMLNRYNTPINENGFRKMVFEFQTPAIAAEIKLHHYMHKQGVGHEFQPAAGEVGYIFGYASLKEFE